MRWTNSRGRGLNRSAGRASEAGEVYGAMDMGWAKLVGQIAQAYGK
jgi:hypothetical protein